MEMNIITLIIAGAILVALFWILYSYSVRRARYLVRSHSGSFSGNMDEKKQTVDAVGISQPIDIGLALANKQPASPIETHQINENVQIKPSTALGA